MEVGAPRLDVLVARLPCLGVDFHIVSSSTELRDDLKVVVARLARAGLRTTARYSYCA
jgi:hypothetical protein